MNTITRRDVYGFDEEWDPVLRAYALAIGRMRDLPVTDPRSLEYQSHVHGIGHPAAPPPDRFRSQCQHNCWYFLPWHRWYLYYFEQIVRSFLRDIDEVADEVAETWALPYWDPSHADTGRLPPEFAAEKLWNGDPNPLHDPTRNRDVNRRVAAINRLEAAPLPGVLSRPFASPNAATATFGGTQSTWQHWNEKGARAGGLEGTPHNNVHQFVGGDMMDFASAGLDPVFWLHHCNIDRYWEVRGHADDPQTWGTERFAFRDEDGVARTEVPAGCIDTVGQLGYRYESVAGPAVRSLGLETRARRIAVAEDRGDQEPEFDDLPPENVGGTDGIHLAGATVESTIDLHPPSRVFGIARGGRRDPRRVYLTVDDITAPADPGISYAVYLGDASDDSRLAGLISFFGAPEPDSGAHGLGYSFDVTDIVADLTAELGLGGDLSTIPVLFVPLGAVVEEGEETQRPVGAADIGSVNLAYQ